jgi:uncharacterized membrane protein (UPF0127 family)
VPRTEYRQVVHVEKERVVLPAARWCDTFLSKLRGFTGRRQLGPNEGLVLVERADSRLASAIHMLFVFCDLGVLWVNDAGQVVDRVVARPWRLSYRPAAPARYVVEASPAIVADVRVGDHIRFAPSGLRPGAN